MDGSAGDQVPTNIGRFGTTLSNRVRIYYEFDFICGIPFNNVKKRVEIPFKATPFKISTLVTLNFYALLKDQSFPRPSQ